MEEDIKNIEEMLEFKEDIIKYHAWVGTKLINSVENLLKRYKELEEDNKQLKDNYKNQIEHTTILAKALNLEEDAPIDEIYAEINKLKTNSIPTSVIEKKIEEVNNSNGYSPVNKIFIEKVLNEILEEGRS